MSDEDLYEADNVVKFDAGLDQGPESLSAQYEKYSVGNVVMVNGFECEVLWVDRDKGLAGVRTLHLGDMS